jgi:CubicO group peptidase (beta-lactamase class C family)
MRPLLVLLTAGLLLGAAPPAREQEEKPKGARAVNSLDGKGRRELRQRWTRAMQDLRVPGMAVVVVQGDEVILETVGVRDLKKRPVTPDTLFYIASCTKPFTATLVARLAEDGKLDLDAPVKRYLPRFQVADDQLTEKLSVRDLLAHRQGLNSRPIVFLDAFTGEITEDRYYHFLKSVKPSKKFGYSNVHFTLAGRVVEAVEGKGWREAMEARLFKPAGMTRTTGYASRLYGDPDAAIPLEPKGEGWVPCAARKSDRTMHAAGGLGSTARDLGRWLRLNLGTDEIGTRVVAGETIKQLQKLQIAAVSKTRVPDYQTDGYGLGWEVATYKRHRVIRHGGGYDGASALIAFMPEKKIGVAVVMNAGGPVQPLTEIVVLDVFNRLLGIDGTDVLPSLIAHVKKTQAKAGAPADPLPVSAKNLSLPPKAYVGTYKNEHWGTLRIENKDGNLAVAIGDLPVPVKSTATNTFQLSTVWGWQDSRFVLEEKRVAAVVVRWEGDGDIRFARKPK